MTGTILIKTQNESAFVGPRTRMYRHTVRAEKSRVRWVTIAVIFVIAGLTVLTFPYAAKWLTSTKQHQELRAYTMSAAQGHEQKFEDALAANTAGDTESALVSLRVEGSDAIGSVSIPEVSIQVPIYPSSSDEDLKRGAGHVPPTSAPVGGVGTHSAISAHTGMPTASMFDRLSDVKVGDDVFIEVLGQLLTYRVVTIVVDTPEEGAAHLVPEPGRDLLTLITCTPYGINTHRLLVTAERTTGSTGHDFARHLQTPKPIWAVVYAAAVGTVLITAATTTSAGKRKRHRATMSPSP